MSEYIKLTWKKFAIIIISIFVLVLGWALFNAQLEAKPIKIDIEAVEHGSWNKKQA